MFRPANVSTTTLLRYTFLVGLSCCLFTSLASAQVVDGGGGLDGGGGFDGGAVDGGGAVVDGGAGNVVDGGGGGAGGGGGGGDGEIESVEPIRLGFEIEDRRNQGFVGSTAEGISNGFVGPPSENNTLGDLGEDRFVGGGTNEGLGGRAATTTSRDLQENGFTVVRQGLRSRLRPSFSSPQMPSVVTESRFRSRISRQPVVRNLGSGVSITMNGRTAVLSGVVNTDAERQIIKRQLRLEPGVYGIEDNTTVAN